MQGKNLPTHGTAVCKQLGVATNSEQKELSNLFPSSRATSSSKRVFDPTADCVAYPQQKKKAAGAGMSATCREVVLMKAFRKMVPIKKLRSELKTERWIQSLQFNWAMTPSAVKEVIMDGFKHIQGFCSYQYLENSSSKLSVASNQVFNEAAVIDRRGALYLCEVKVSKHPLHINTSITGHGHFLSNVPVPAEKPFPCVSAFIDHCR